MVNAAAMRTVERDRMASNVLRPIRPRARVRGRVDDFSTRELSMSVSVSKSTVFVALLSLFAACSSDDNDGGGGSTLQLAGTGGSSLLAINATNAATIVHSQTGLIGLLPGDRS
jgi:hypothetical protein